MCTYEYVSVIMSECESVIVSVSVRSERGGLVRRSCYF